VNEERIVGEQPHMGVMMKSLNGRTWTAYQLDNIKFKLYRAKFDPAVSADFMFENDGNASRRRVPMLNFSTVNGSRFITIKHKFHGTNVNEYVRIYPESSPQRIHDSPIPEYSYNGIPVSELYGSHVVRQVNSIDEYVIEVDTPANRTGAFEDVSRYVWIDSNLNFMMYRLNSSEFVPQGTEIRYFSNLITGKDYDGGQTPKVPISEKRIHNGDNNFLTDVALAQISDNEITKSVQIRAALKTGNDYVSPVIYTDNVSVVAAGLAINDPVDDLEWSANNEDGKVSSKAKTQVITLKTPADSLRVFTLESKQRISDIEIYFRTASDRDIQSKNWVLLEPEQNAAVVSTEEYIEIERRIDGIPEFDEFQLKIIFKGVNSVKYPSIKELRAIAVAG
jgi:hypothetical protein